MSYPPLTGYGSYYDPNPNSNAQPSYGSNRQPGGGGYQQYQQEERQPQYGSTVYEWQGQNQPPSANAPQSYSNDSFREVNGQGSQLDYGREASNFSTQAAVGSSGQTYYGSSTSQPMQGLNNLAYASGLDNPRQPSRSQPQGGSSSKYSTTPSAAPNRVQSPMRALQQQHYSSAQATNYGVHDGSANSMSSPQLAISAAQALAGAVSRKYQQGGAAQKTTSPAMSSGASIQRTLSPYSTSSNQQNHARGSSGQLPVTQQQQQPSTRIASPNDVRHQTASMSRARGAQHKRTPSQTGRSAASQSSSISNLVSTTQEPAASTVAAEPMPTYIDPSQVFNPYHKEHERRRKEAAEAEVQRKEEEAATAKAQEEHKRKEAEVAANAKKTTNRKKGDNAVQKAPLKAASPVEDEMATEMKMMMEKMKEFRSKDPSLFQKLWEDMRKGGSGSISTTASSVNSAPPPPPAPAPAPAAKPTNPAATAINSATSAVNSAISAMTAAAIPAHSPPPHLPQLNNSTEPSPVAATPSGPRPRLPKSQRPKSAASDLPGNHPGNGYNVVVENNEEGLPDLGRFPSERRIRAKGTPAAQMPVPTTGSTPIPGLENQPVPNQPLPSRSSSGGVAWPKEKRAALAAAAIDSLKANPENEDVAITPADIHAMLDEEPSYIQLCGLLEGKGLKFHCGQFARQLLSSVPDLTAHSKGNDAPRPPTVPVAGSSTVPHPPPHILYPQPPAGPPMGYLPSPMPPNGFVPQPNPQFQVQRFQHVIPPGIKSELRPPPSQTAAKVKRNMIPMKKEPPPGSKEAMARKRDFSELIDLTQLSDNEDYVLSSKHPRLASSSPELDPFEAWQMQQQHLQTNTLQPEPFASNSIGLPGRSPLKFDPSQPARIHTPVYTPAPLPPPQKSKTILARSINKSEALRKSYYDPKTVARDILIAAGRHPSERPLNAHMAGLLGVHIDIDSDLNTFDWDAIDPGGPPPPKVELTDVPAGPPRYPSGDAVEKSRSRVEAEGEPRPDGSGKRGMQEPPAPASSTSPVGNNSVRSELKPSKLRQAHAVDGDPSSSRGLTSYKQVVEVDPSPPSQRSSSRQPRPSMESGPSPLPASGKRRGRPFGSKNKAPSLSAMKKAARPPQPVIEIPTPSTPQGNAVFKCRWISCGTELHNFDTLCKHVARVHTPNKAEVEDHGFVCWWKNCRYLTRVGSEVYAEHDFNNFDEWLNHIKTDHLHKIALKQGDGPNTAQIGKQASASLDVTQFLYNPTETSARTISYTDPQSIAQDKTRYLSDPQGKVTTPSVSEKRNADLPPDTLVLTKKNTGEDAAVDMAAQKSFLKVHHRDQKIGAKMNAEEVLRAMEKRKREIGPGIDRGGCTLVNEHRRSTFVQSPGIRRVVDANY